MFVVAIYALHEQRVAVKSTEQGVLDLRLWAEGCAVCSFCAEERFRKRREGGAPCGDARALQRLAGQRHVDLRADATAGRAADRRPSEQKVREFSGGEAGNPIQAGATTHLKRV